MIVSMIMHKKTSPKKYYSEKSNETTGIEIQSQYWGGNTQLSMEGIVVEYFQIKLILVAIKKIEFHSYISDDNE